MASVCGPLYSEPEDYLKFFDTKEYLKIDHAKYSRPNIAMWHDAVSASTLRKKRLLDVGTGPSLLSVVSASRLCDSITLSDFVPSNRDHLGKWINQERDAHVWTPVFQIVANLEGNGTTAEDVENRLRAAVEREVLPCDVHNENPLEPATPEPFDIITTQLCLECACRSQEEYVRALCNIGSLLKPGGVVYQSGALEANYFALGAVTFKDIYLTVDSIKEAFLSSGFRDVQVHTRRYKQGEVPIDLSDVKGTFLATAVKV